MSIISGIVSKNGSEMNGGGKLQGRLEKEIKGRSTES